MRTKSGIIITRTKIIKIAAPDQPITVAENRWSRTELYRRRYDDRVVLSIRRSDREMVFPGLAVELSHTHTQSNVSSAVPIKIE